MDLFRITTAGSVDDGKSTLIGRLLFDLDRVPEDHLAEIEAESRRRGSDAPDLSLLTDGLQDERAQGITIDVAYRYFETDRRKFVVADAPGHAQYTRNMVTGASTADLAVLLVDAAQGLTTQTRRHLVLTALLHVPHVVVVVNKMDRVGWAEARFEALRQETAAFCESLDVADLQIVPVCALDGDNVVRRSDRLPWYDGPTLLYHLETAHAGARRNLRDLRLPVQYILREGGYRGYAGTVASGRIRPGDEVVSLPSGQRSRVAQIRDPAGPTPEARPGEAVVVTLEDAIDVARGDVIARPLNLPLVDTRVDATLFWMAEAPLVQGQQVQLRHGAREIRAFVTDILHQIDVDTLHRQPVSTVGVNEVARVRVTCTQPLAFDPYRRNRETGGFVLIDPSTRDTIAAGVIREPVREVRDRADLSQTSPHVTSEADEIGLEAREARQGHRAAVVWLTGLPASGKTTVARGVERALFDRGARVTRLDGDRLRHGLSGDLGFSPADRSENIRRAAELARLLFEQGHVVVCAFVSPYASDRRFARARVPAPRFFEVFVDTPVEVCAERDPKGLYAKARRGEIVGFTGVDAPYEAPTAPDLRLTPDLGPEAQVEAVLAGLGPIIERDT